MYGDCMNMVRVNYHLTKQQVAKIKEISADTGLSVAELIRRSVDEYIRAKEKKKGDSEE